MLVVWLISVAAHLTAVEDELRARDVGSLSASQQAWRAQLIDVLHDYRLRGVFPRNTDLPYESPVFVDRFGAHCAMGYLIAASGRHDIVARIAMTRNFAYVVELADDPTLVKWLDEHGFTAAEAARIQPAYPGPATGQLCWPTGRTCQSGPCVPVDAQIAYCSERCDPAQPNVCPTTDYGAMQCAMHAEYTDPICTYQMPFPGSIGQACDDHLDCVGPCLLDEPTPICTYACFEDQPSCPRGYSCSAEQDNRICRPDQGGCHVGGSASPLLVLGFLLRRKRTTIVQ